MTNTNPETGIRYGYISANSLNSDLLQELLYSYGVDLSYNEAADNLFNEAMSDAKMQAADAGVIFDKEAFQDEWECPDIDIDEPIFAGTCEGVNYQVSWLGGAINLFIFESPVTGYYDLCSPCVPGAVNLDNPNANGYLGYDVPAEWRAVL